MICRIYFYLNSDINIKYFKVVSISIENQIKDYSKAISISMKFYWTIFQSSLDLIQIYLYEKNISNIT